jgi:hypothetical protein
VVASRAGRAHREIEEFGEQGYRLRFGHPRYAVGVSTDEQRLPASHGMGFD